MQIIVTGGLGFIGSHFIRHLLKKYPGYSIVNLDKVTYAGNGENLRDAEHNRSYRFVKGDICDAALVRRLMKGADAVINFAAETHVDRSIEDAGSFVKTDVLGTYTLLDAAKDARIKRFLHISTDEVYGSIQKGSFTENSPLRPNSPYAASKAGGDMLVRAYRQTFGLPTIITRSSNNYGPYQYPEKFIPLFVTSLLQGRKVPLYGDGKNVRDWLYVEDNCAAIDLVFHKGVFGETYNIGGDCEKENIDVVRLMLRHLAKGEDSINYVKDRLGHDRRYSVDSSKVKKLGWEPKMPFEEGVRLTIKWYKENEQWWKKAFRK